jgi:hypothetical protein
VRALAPHSVGGEGTATPRACLQASPVPGGLSPLSTPPHLWVFIRRRGSPPSACHKCVAEGCGGWGRRFSSLRDEGVRSGGMHPAPPPSPFGESGEGIRTRGCRLRKCSASEVPMGNSCGARPLAMHKKGGRTRLQPLRGGAHLSAAKRFGV